jgi:hypothetical protein
MGSLVIILLLRFLPTRLDYSRDLAIQSELTEAQAANAELAQIAARTATAPASVAVPALQFGRLRPARFIQFLIFGDFCGSSHVL